MMELKVLEEELVELKLKKRSYVLANKETKEVDELIKDIELRIGLLDKTQID